MQTFPVEPSSLAATAAPDHDLDELSLDELRAAIHQNRVSFPAQVPSFTRIAPADIQWRIVQLYFIRGWSTIDIGKRYGLTTRERVRQILKDWKRHAICLGYMQPIPQVRPRAESVPQFPVHLFHPAGTSSEARVS